MVDVFLLIAYTSIGRGGVHIEKIYMNGITSCFTFSFGDYMQVLSYPIGSTVGGEGLRYISIYIKKRPETLFPPSPYLILNENVHHFHSDPFHSSIVFFLFLLLF